MPTFAYDEARLKAAVFTTWGEIEGVRRLTKIKLMIINLKRMEPKPTFSSASNATMPTDKWTAPPDEFRYIQFERIDAETNARRYYYVAWLSSLFGPAILRVHGRKSQSQRIAIEQAADLASAWPSIRATIRTRLRHGYIIVGEG